MDLLEFFTGHSSDEASVYENQDKVDSVVSKLTDLGSKSIPTMAQNIADAVAKYNSVNGVGTYVSDLDPDYFTSMMEGIGEGVTTISTNISGAADDIKAYNEANIFEKIGSSAAMLACKVGEGFLSVFEGLGDAVVSVAGWIAPKGSDFEKACEDFVKDQWSHDLFNFYYNSDFAKKSAFTEDSAIAGVGKLAGTVAAFVVPGMAFSAVAGAIGEGASAAVSIANTIANSSKIINVVSAGMMGMGSATEAGLLAGKSMDDAALAGAEAGALSAGLAFGISTVAEKLGSVIGKGAGAADDALNQTDDVLRLSAEERLALPGALEDGTPVGKGLAGKGAGAIDDALNQVDDVANGTQKLLTGKERLALPGELADGTPVGKGLAGKGAGAIDDIANQADDVANGTQKLLTGEERLALPGALEDGTPVGRTAAGTGSKTTVQQQMAKEYVDNLDDFLEKKVSVEQYFELKDESLISSATRADAGAVFKDPTGELDSIARRVGQESGIKQTYLNQAEKKIMEISDKPLAEIDMQEAETSLKSIFGSAGLDTQAQDDLWSIYKYRIRSDITPDTKGMFEALKSHMTEEEVTRISGLVDDSYSARLAESATQAQKEAAYVYTKNGYEEMNATLTGDVKGYYGKFYGANNQSESEMLQSVFKEAIGDSSNAEKCVQELQQLVRDNRVQDNIVVHRSIKDFGGLKKVKELKVGTQFHNEGFTSATASMEDFETILGEMTKNNIRLDIIVPKGSEAAYIEPLSGIPRYLQNEVLINPDSTLTIIAPAYQEKVGKRLVTVVKCLLT